MIRFMQRLQPKHRFWHDNLMTLLLSTQIMQTGVVILPKKSWQLKTDD